jgi:phosphatidylglycerophosphate synthase
MNVPNKITTARIILVPFLLYFLWQKNITVSVILFSTIMLGDILDGYFARKLKQATKLGMVLDSFADRTVMVPTFIILVLKYNLDLKLAIMLLTRDLFYLIGGLLVIIFVKERKKFVIPPLKVGKATTVMLTATALAIITGFYPWFFMIATIILSVTAATMYFVRAIKHYKEIKKA